MYFSNHFEDGNLKQIFIKSTVLFRICQQSAALVIARDADFINVSTGVVERR